MSSSASSSLFSSSAPLPADHHHRYCATSPPNALPRARAPHDSLINRGPWAIGWKFRSLKDTAIEPNGWTGGILASRAVPCEDSSALAAVHSILRRRRSCRSSRRCFHAIATGMTTQSAHKLKLSDAHLTGWVSESPFRFYGAQPTDMVHQPAGAAVRGAPPARSGGLKPAKLPFPKLRHWTSTRNMKLSQP